MELEAQCLLIRDFMMAVAPAVTAHSLETGASMIENAGMILECSMQLAARYNELHETLSAPPQNPAPAQNPAQKRQPQTGAPTAPVHKTQARVPVPKSEVPDLRSPGSGRPSPLSPDWEPPDPYR